MKKINLAYYKNFSGQQELICRLMKSIFAFIFFVFCSISISFSQTMNTELLYEKASRGVVTIRTNSNSGGTGFLISELGYILTNQHVISYDRKITVHFPDGSSYPVLRVADRLDEDMEDVALLYIGNVIGHEVLPLLPEGETRPGAEVAVIGSPLSFEFTIVNGIVSSLLPRRDTPFRMQFSAPVNPGNSGSPLLNRNGQIVGIVTSRIDESNDGRSVTGVGFATNATTLRNFLKKNGVEYKIVPILSDAELISLQQPTPEELEALQHARLLKIEQERIYDSLQMVARMAGQRDEILRQQQIEQERLLKQQELSYQLQQKEAERLKLAEKQKKEEQREIRKSKPPRIGLKLGLGGHYYIANWQQIDNPFDRYMLSFLGSAMLAYRYNLKPKGKYGRGNSFGLFANYGLINTRAVEAMVLQNDLSLPGLPVGKSHQFLEAETGWLFGEWFRLSGGLGRQIIACEESITVRYNYYTFSTGFVMRFNMTEIDLSATALTGGLYREPALRATLSINIHLKAGRW
jgi:hypothetical protein